MYISTMETIATMSSIMDYYDVSENVHLILNSHAIDVKEYIHHLINNECNNNFKKKYDGLTQFHIMDSLNRGYNAFDYKIETNEVDTTDETITFSKINHNAQPLQLSNAFNCAINGLTNFSDYKTHAAHQYDKLLRISVICDNSETLELVNQSVPLQKIPFESFAINDDIFKSHFNIGQLLPLYNSCVFHNQYIAFHGNALFSTFDVFCYSILTLTMPIFIGTNLNHANHILSDLISRGFDMNGILIFDDNLQFIEFMQSVKWEHYDARLNALMNNKSCLARFILDCTVYVQCKLNEGHQLAQKSHGLKNVIDLIYANHTEQYPTDFNYVIKVLIDVKLKNKQRYDLNHVTKVISFAFKIKHKKSSNNSTLHFHETCERTTTLWHDIVNYVDNKHIIKNKSAITCFVSSLEPDDVLLSGVVGGASANLQMSHLPNKDLNLLSTGWMHSWFSLTPNYNDFKQNKQFNVSYLFSLRGISELAPNMYSDRFTYMVRQYIIDNPHQITIPKKIYMTTWNKELPKKYPHVPLIPDSKECLYYSMFNISLENSKQINYYSEKIIDCFLTFTVPLYIGCPNIAEYYDTRGIVFAQDEHDLMRKCNQMTPNVYYSMEEYCMNNHRLVKSWTNKYWHTNAIFNYISAMEKYYLN